MQEVGGSIPPGSTNDLFPFHQVFIRSAPAVALACPDIGMPRGKLPAATNRKEREGAGAMVDIDSRCNERKECDGQPSSGES